MIIKFISWGKFVVFLLILSCPIISFSHTKTTPDSPIHINSEGKLEYKADERGNRVPDFSYCGYMASEMAIPDVPVKVIVTAMEGDATEQIQTAINYVSSLPLDKNGFRGTILLEKGIFRVDGSITINASGVVLRGNGCNSAGTILVGAGVDRETLIRITGKNNRKIEVPLNLAGNYFPVNSTILTFKNGHHFKVGDQVIVNRPSTKEWIEKTGTDKIGIYVDYTLTNWTPGDFDINWDRTVIAVSPESITIDVPITNSLDPQFGGANVAKYVWDGRIRNVGVENIRCISTFDKSNIKDENHRWMAITMDNVSDSWVRRIVAENFVSSAVAVWESARRITVEDCKSLAPVGEIANYRRYSFHTIGQQVLFQRCYAEYAYHAFSVGFTAPGPNAFVQCYSYMPYNFSGAIGGWATGVLFDKMTVDGGNISFAYRDVDGQGGGWSAANSLCWQCRAAQIHLPAPPTAQNWAYASWAQGYGNGHHELQHTFVKPESIYYAQLEARTGKKSPETGKILVYESKETTAPTPEYTVEMSKRSKSPDLIMDVWIDRMIEHFPFADLADQKGLLFLQEHYLQHNIIEEGAHWADYPWRSANNINNPGFAENPSYAGDKRVYMAEEFYDTTNSLRNHLHRQYIRKSLDNFKDNSNIIHHLGMEYTGPLHFVEFWLDVIGEWEKENNKKVLVMLPGTKDVQDAILADPKRSALVDIIDVIQWQYRKDGSLYSPGGGVSLAGRQYPNIMDVGETSFNQIYRAVNQFHTKYPEKAIAYTRRGAKFSEWAVFMAGGSLASLPIINDAAFFENALGMANVTMKNPLSQQYVLGKKGTGYIIFCESRDIKIDLSDDKNNYSLKWINPSTGEILYPKIRIIGGTATSIDAPFEDAAVAWLYKK